MVRDKKRKKGGWWCEWEKVWRGLGLFWAWLKSTAKEGRRPPCRSSSDRDRASDRRTAEGGRANGREEHPYPAQLQSPHTLYAIHQQQAIATMASSIASTSRNVLGKALRKNSACSASAAGEQHHTHGPHTSRRWVTNWFN